MAVGSAVLRRRYACADAAAAKRENGAEPAAGAKRQAVCEEKRARARAGGEPQAGIAVERGKEPGRHK